MVAPLWTPFTRSGRVLYERLTIEGQKVVIVQWHEKRRLPPGGIFTAPGSTTFQTQLWENGDIVHAYGRMNAIKYSQKGDPDPRQEHFGGVGTVGIQAPGGAEGIQFLHKVPALYEGLSLRFIRR